MRAVNRGRTDGTLAVVVACLAGLAACASTATAGESAGSATTTWDGVYTADQAERGQRLLDRQCATCHAGNLRGTQAAPAIAGLEMLYVWDGRSLGELLEYLRVSMPPGQVGSLSDQEYTDIIATILEHSGFPGSEAQELPGDSGALDRIVIRRENPQADGG